jgi:5-methylcytosine-specific restriction endonuclease McrA
MPLSEFHQDRRRKDGRVPWCRACVAGADRVRRQDRPRSFPRSDDLKECPRCKVGKAASEFHRRASSRDGLTSQCRACIKTYNRGHHAANPEPTRARAKQYQLDNPEVHRESSRNYYARNRDKAAAAVASWKANNAERHRANQSRAQQRRRALQEGATRTVEWTADEVLERDGWRCEVPVCRCPEGREIRADAPYRSQWHATIDHIVPLSRGGSDDPDNLRAAHHSCNASKGDLLDEELLLLAHLPLAPRRDPVRS